MRGAFAINGPNVLKCLPLGCKSLGGLKRECLAGITKPLMIGAKNIVSMAAPIWNGEIEDVYSMTALAFASTSKRDVCMRFLKFLKSSDCTLFVGNCNIPESVRELLLDLSVNLCRHPQKTLMMR